MIRVLTLNLWHDAGPWPERRARIGDWLDRLEPDLIGMQEVLLGDGIDQAAELLEKRGYHHAYVAAVEDWAGRKGVAFGNVAASRWPIVGQEVLRLPDRGDTEKRAALSLCVDAPVGPLAFTCTHLHWQMHHGYVREQQVAALCDFVVRTRPDPGFPPILVGDFNAEPDASEVRYVCGLQSLGGRSVHFRDAWRMAGDGGPGFTYSNVNPYAVPWREPDRRLDYVFVGPPHADGVGSIERCQVVCDEPKDGIWPSDHFGVYAELRSTP